MSPELNVLFGMLALMLVNTISPIGFVVAIFGAIAYLLVAKPANPATVVPPVVSAVVPPPLLLHTQEELRHAQEELRHAQEELRSRPPDPALLQLQEEFQRMQEELQRTQAELRMTRDQVRRVTARAQQLTTHMDGMKTELDNRERKINALRENTRQGIAAVMRSVEQRQAGGQWVPPPPPSETEIAAYTASLRRGRSVEDLSDTVWAHKLRAQIGEEAAAQAIAKIAADSALPQSVASTSASAASSAASSAATSTASSPVPPSMADVPCGSLDGLPSDLMTRAEHAKMSYVAMCMEPLSFGTYSIEVLSGVADQRVITYSDGSTTCGGVKIFRTRDAMVHYYAAHFGVAAANAAPFDHSSMFDQCCFLIALFQWNSMYFLGLGIVSPFALVRHLQSNNMAVVSGVPFDSDANSVNSIQRVANVLHATIVSTVMDSRTGKLIHSGLSAVVAETTSQFLFVSSRHDVHFITVGDAFPGVAPMVPITPKGTAAVVNEMMAGAGASALPPAQSVRSAVAAAQGVVNEMMHGAGASVPLPASVQAAAQAPAQAAAQAAARAMMSGAAGISGAQLPAAKAYMQDW